jgi:large subunit ribosomal protein L33
MASVRVKVKMQSSESHYFITTTKNPRTTTNKLAFKRYDPVIRKHVIFNEKKVK